MAEDVAVPDPGADPVGVDQYRITLAWGDVDRVRSERDVERDAVFGDYQLRELVLLHGMHEETLVVVVVDQGPMTG